MLVTSPAPSLNLTVTDQVSPATGVPVRLTLRAKLCVGSGVNALAVGLKVKLVSSVLPAVLTMISATPAARADRLPAVSALTLAASAALMASSDSPASARWLNCLTVPAISRATVQVVPATGLPESTRVLVASPGQGASKVTL